MNQNIGDKYPCPECGKPGKRRTSNTYQKTTRHYMECHSCEIKYAIREDVGWLPEDRYYGPTPAMIRLITLWAGSGVAKSLGTGK